MYKHTLAGGPKQRSGVEPEFVVESPADRVEDRQGIRLLAGSPQEGDEARLHGLGIWHFEQMAGWTPRNIEWVGSYLAFPGRIEREDWVGQAKTLSTGGETEFAMRAKAGLVETSRDDGSAGQDNVAELVTDGDALAGKPEDKPAP